ncbi:ankyrin repeat domain-containing protein 33B-like [Cylas formicarius]|uniref:ankyrin repeat domain-containing protein 33B-like n=1 Tax=Cylas formicarius TaxID=197179 RepID=UPI0029583679|nr:ankyrin repeat domain-containing protein 33B-like [Cylas formicarius]
MTAPLRVACPKISVSSQFPVVSEHFIRRPDSARPERPARRVRFALPPTDGDARLVGDVDADVALSKQTHSRPKFGGCWRDKYIGFSQRPFAKQTSRKRSVERRAYDTSGRFATYHHRFPGDAVQVPVTGSPGVRNRVHPTGRYIRGTLSPTSNAAPQNTPASPGGQALLRAARDGDEQYLRDHLRRALTVGIPEQDLNAVDCSGRTLLSYAASNGSIDILEIILQLQGLDPNKPDNEGNTPLHFAAQAGQVECLNCLASRCRGVDIDAKNNLGFTPLMKAALQGRNKCAKLLLFAGADPTLRDNGRGFRADQWARFCGRYVCADVIEKHARQRLLERSTSYGSWGLEHDMGAAVVMGKVIPIPPPVAHSASNGIKSKLRKVFRTSSGPSDTFSSARLVTQLTSAALCASSPVLPSSGAVPPVVKSLIRPLTVPRLQITLANNNGDYPNRNVEREEVVASGHKEVADTSRADSERNQVVPSAKPARTKKRK